MDRIPEPDNSGSLLHNSLYISRMMGTLQFNNILHSKLLGDIHGINSISIYGRLINYLGLLAILASD
jgi:hypothetical protein